MISDGQISNASFQEMILVNTWVSASLFGPGMNWLNVLIIEGQVDHSIAASSPIFRNDLESDKTGSLLW